MAEDGVGRHEYASDWSGHRREHEVIETRVTKLEVALVKVAETQQEHLTQMREIKWLVLIIAASCFPQLLRWFSGMVGH